MFCGISRIIPHLTVNFSYDTIQTILENCKRNDEESKLPEVLQRSPVSAERDEWNAIEDGF